MRWRVREAFRALEGFCSRERRRDPEAYGPAGDRVEEEWIGKQYHVGACPKGGGIRGGSTPQRMWVRCLRQLERRTREEHGCTGLAPRAQPELSLALAINRNG